MASTIITSTPRTLRSRRSSGDWPNQRRYQARCVRPSTICVMLYSRTKAATASDDTLAGLSARNRLHGYVEEVRVDGLLAQVRLRVGDEMLTAVITADAVRALKLRRGDDAVAVIKSTEVMIAR